MFGLPFNEKHSVHKLVLYPHGMLSLRRQLGTLYEVPLLIALLGIVGVIVMPYNPWIGAVFLVLAGAVCLYFLIIPPLHRKFAVRRTLRDALAKQSLAPDAVFHGDVSVAMDAKQRKIVVADEDGGSRTYGFDELNGVEIESGVSFGRGIVYSVEFRLREPEGHAVRAYAKSRGQAERWAKRARKLLGFRS